MKKVGYYLAQCAKKSKTFRLLLRKLLFTKNSLKYNLFVPLKVENNLILFESFNGRSYSDSPKFIYEYMISHPEYKDYRFVWAFKEPKKHNLKNTIIVESNSKEYYKYCSKSKYWVVNSLMPEYIKKKKNQIYFQTWHGTPLKKLRYDIECDGSVLNSLEEIRKRNDLDVKKIDYFLSPSAFATKCFTSAFNLKALNKENIVLEKGYPRNDSILKYTEDNKLSIKKELGLPLDKKVILYAPTFRDNQHLSGSGYTYKLELDFDKLRDNLEDDYIILFKTHYFISNSFDFKKYNGFIYNVSNYEEINDLYSITDLLITDYSSVFFDYAITNKPMIFYMYDLEEYQNKLRGFYFDINELPGPITKNENELLTEINNLSSYKEKWNQKYKEFNEKFNYLNKDNTTKNIVESIFK